MTKNMSELDVLKSIYRTQLSSFLKRSIEELFPGRTYRDNWHIQATLYQLELILSGETTRLIVNIPPRYFKSTIVSVVFVAYQLGLDPTKKVIVVSYANELVVELSNLTRDLMQSDFYQWVFPETKISKQKNTESHFKTTKGGGRLATTVGSAVTGFGADVILADDLVKPGDVHSEVKLKKANEYLQNTLLSRLENKKTGIMIINHQRLHPEDTTGFALEMGDWVHLKLPAIATEHELIAIGPDTYHERQPGEALDPEREDVETLKKIEREVGPLTFSAQWQQMPTPPGGRLFKLEQFMRYDELPPIHYCQGYVISLDPAVTAAETSDYSAITIWLVYGERYFLVNVWRDKVEFPDLETKCCQLDAQYNPLLFLIEGSHIGKALRANAWTKEMIHFRTLNPIGEKVARAAIQLSKIAAGKVFLPNIAPWLGDFEREISEFPVSKYDDQADSMVQFLHAMDFRIDGLNT